MNWLSPCTHPNHLRSALFGLLLAVAACHAEPEQVARDYDLEFRLTPLPAAGTVRVEMRVRQDRHWLRQVEFDRDPRYGGFDGDGDIDVGEQTVQWRVPTRSGTLAWEVRIESRRGSSYDAYMDVGWAVFRAEDVIPRMSSVTALNVASKTTLRFDLPAGWSAATPYPDRRGVYRVRKSHRRLDLPAGWIALGNLGTRFDTVGATRVVVAGPANQGVRRLDMLAFLRWTLPELERVLPEPMRRLTVISAGDPMWRGGLSAPTSLFIHADLPLISENGTSLLLHEVMHVAMNLDVAAGHDWIQEGLAEYYSIELLQRSGSLSARRHAKAVDDAREWGGDIDSLCGDESTGATTAAAVALLHDLNEELGAADRSVDDLLLGIIELDRPVDTPTLIEFAETLLGSTSAVLATDMLSACRS